MVPVKMNAMCHKLTYCGNKVKRSRYYLYVDCGASHHTRSRVLPYLLFLVQPLQGYQQLDIS